MDLTDPTSTDNSRLRRVLGTEPYRTLGSEPAPSAPAPAPASAPASAAPPTADQAARGGDQDTDRSPARRRQAGKESTIGEFTGGNVPLQVKVPSDLVQSLKLHAINRGMTISELVLECLTSEASIGKAWVSTRRAG